MNTFERAVRDAIANAHRRGDMDPPGYYDDYADARAPRVAAELRAALRTEASSQCCDCGKPIMSELCDACRQLEKQESDTNREPT